jgi:hypothetical protein
MGALWGYIGKLFTDLELYDDYVDKERPDVYYQNDLPDMGMIFLTWVPN